MKDYKKEQLKRKLTSFPKVQLLKPVSSRKKGVVEDGEYIVPFQIFDKHYKNGIKVTLSRKDRRALQFERNINKQAREAIQIKKQWWLRYA